MDPSHPTPANSSLQSNSNTTIRLFSVGLLVFIPVAMGGYLAKNLILRQYDALRLAAFSRQLADADRILATWHGSSVQLTFAGEDVRKIVRAAASGVSARMPDAEFMCMYSARATFFRGTNLLGYISVCDDLYIIESGSHPFFDTSGHLKSAVYVPLLNKVTAQP